MTPTAQLTATALFALLGAFVGAWLTRRSEYEKWYRQEKSNAFAEYLRQLHDTRLRASDLYYGTEGTAQHRSLKATEEFARLGKFTALARLYMSAAGRQALSDMQNKLWVCTVQSGPANRANEIRTLMEEIQDLIEAELEHLPGKCSW